MHESERRKVELLNDDLMRWVQLKRARQAINPQGLTTELFIQGAKALCVNLDIEIGQVETRIYQHIGAK